jgi:hypothetical protein
VSLLKDTLNDDKFINDSKRKAYVVVMHDLRILKAYGVAVYLPYVSMHMDNVMNMGYASMLCFAVPVSIGVFGTSMIKKSLKRLVALPDLSQETE